MAKIQLCSGYTGADPVVRVFFFAPPWFKGVMKNDDEAILAVKNSGVVGGLLLHEGKVVCKKGTPYVKGVLMKELRKCSQ